MVLKGKEGFGVQLLLWFFILALHPAGENVFAIIIICYFIHPFIFICIYLVNHAAGTQTPPLS